jgi:hypothetical protein
MTDRVLAVLAQPRPELPGALAAALLEDVIDLVGEMPLVTPVVATTSQGDHDPARFTWPGTTVVEVPARAGIAEVFAVLAGATPSAEAVTLLAPDVPDLPPLLVGKLFSALAGRREPVVAVCPAQGGAAVAVAARIPPPQWLEALDVGLDDADVLERLRAATGSKGSVVVVPGWHRIRSAADLSVLDPMLEGWEATRAYLQS